MGNFSPRRVTKVAHGIRASSTKKQLPVSVKLGELERDMPDSFCKLQVLHTIRKLQQNHFKEAPLGPYKPEHKHDLVRIVADDIASLVCYAEKGDPIRSRFHSISIGVMKGKYTLE